MDGSTTQFVTRHGDPQAVDNEILRTVVGSGVHGIAIEGTDDHDEMGVYVETPAAVLGVEVPHGHHVARTQPEGHRSGPGDTDLVLYSLRKYLRLAVQGNPTVLLPLFAPDHDVLVTTPLGRELQEFGPSVLSQRAGHRFLGYLQGQRRRMVDGGRGVPNRPELVAAHGFDTKYASHALRLAIQGIEVTRTGRLTLPMPEDDRALVTDVKRGGYPQPEVLRMIDARAAQLTQLLADGRSPLPADPDVAAVNAWSAAAHLRFWGASI